MIKFAVAVIKYEDKVLLMRRASNQFFAGTWEFPGGKVETGERISAALRRELDEELNITANVGKLITSVSFGPYEIYAYNVKYCDGLIRLGIHDNMEWVTLEEALQYNLLPADKKIIMHMTNTKEKKQTKSNIQSFVSRRLQAPVLNDKTNRWEIKIGSQTKSFATQQEAMNFYVDEARKILHPFFSETQIIRG